MTETNHSSSPVTHSDSTTQVRSAEGAPNPLFRLVIVATVAFLLTILLLLATTFSPSGSPSRQVLDRYGMKLIGIELAVILISGFLAMALDRRQTLIRKSKPETKSPAPDGSGLNESEMPSG